MPTPYSLSLVSGAELVRKSATGLVFCLDDRQIAFQSLDPSVVEALAGLLESNLAAAMATDSGSVLNALAEHLSAAALATYFFALGRLDEAGLLVRHFSLGQDGFLSLEPLSHSFRFCDQDLSADGVYRFSAFAYLKPEGTHWIAVSPFAHARLVLRGDAIFTHLAPLLDGAIIGPEFPWRSDRRIGALKLMLNAGLLIPATADSPSASDATQSGTSQPGEFWEFHDLLFHTTSRLGWHRDGYGARSDTANIDHKLESDRQPHLAACGDTIPLFMPNLGQIIDPPFQQVLETRRSQRRFANPPITVRQLGEFLFRSQRTIRRADGTNRPSYRRPYPNGGALYELSCYLAVANCDGIEPGLYRYDPDGHCLQAIGMGKGHITELCAEAAAAAMGAGPIQILLLLACAFPRTARRYKRLAYALTLKNAGAILQTFYLTATAMGLGGCALGGGDSMLFAKKSGTHPFIEPSVAEFILGSCASTKI